MQRMMFEDLSTSFPSMEINYCCPEKYLKLASDHPFVKSFAIEKTNDREYGAVYDISTACRVHESRSMGLNTLHRSDIWANHCGFNLTNHNCHMEAKNVSYYKDCLKSINPNNLPTVLFATKSTNCPFGIAKSLTDQQVFDTCKSLIDSGYFVFTIHDSHLDLFEMMGLPQLTNIEIESWIGMVEAADYVISIDTGTFHMAGSLGKPLVGIFSFTNGKIYGKYYDFELVQKHRDNGDWDCGPCYMFVNCPKSNSPVKPCMKELTSEDIMKAFRKIIEKTQVAGISNFRNLQLKKDGTFNEFERRDQKPSTE